jgi:CBS domain containing-hemolysin-like protein
MATDPAPGPVPLSGSDAAPQQRRLLSELGARLARALRDLRRHSSVQESLEAVIEESEREAQQLSQQERLMLGNLLKFGELKIADVMVPRADIIAVEESAPLSELVRIFREAQHSRLPVYRETLDDPLGMIHVKDVLALVEIGPDGTLSWRDTPVSKLRREVLFAPPAMPALDLLLKMQTSRIHLALVVDEYGGTDGLVSIEDLVEEIVGDIDDEHDVDEEARLVARQDGSFDAEARIDLDDFRERTGIDLGSGEEGEDVDTLGGLVSTLLGRVPVRGEIVVHPAGFEIEILEADPRRIKSLRIRRPPAPPPEEPKAAIGAGR